MECELKGVRILCGGRMVGNLCMDHEVMFDIWGCNGGYKIYDERGRKEGQKEFRKWLESLSDKGLEAARKYG